MRAVQRVAMFAAQADCNEPLNAPSPWLAELQLSCRVRGATGKQERRLKAPSSATAARSDRLEHMVQSGVRGGLACRYSEFS
jgi:hypothetical protein